MDELRNSPKADGKEKIYTHGEKEVLAIEKIKEQGIAVDVKTVYEMKQMSDYLGMDFEKYFGKNRVRQRVSQFLLKYHYHSNICKGVQIMEKKKSGLGKYRFCISSDGYALCGKLQKMAPGMKED